MWIAAHFSARHLRIWAHGQSRIDTACAPLPDPTQWFDVLLSLVAPYATPHSAMPVVCAGMPPQRFVQVPCSVAPAQKRASPDPRITLYAMPAISQSQPADIMQGEEGQIIGFLGQNPDWEGVLCLPSACTRWVHISAGEVVSFRSFLTGVLFEWLTQESSLRDATDGQGLDEEVFLQALSDAMARPERLGSALFEVQAKAVLDQARPAAGRAQALGTLIGVELAATRAYWLGRDVALIGAVQMRSPYASALAAQGVKATQHDGDELALAGLTQACGGLGLA
jgi:2-dehydro-3-deoxygalactonokinase